MAKDKNVVGICALCGRPVDSRAILMGDKHYCLDCTASATIAPPQPKKKKWPILAWLLWTLLFIMIGMFVYQRYFKGKGPEDLKELLPAPPGQSPPTPGRSPDRKPRPEEQRPR